MKETISMTTGVFRCCLAAFQKEYGQGDKEVGLGTKFECPYCKEKFTLIPEKDGPMFVPEWQRRARQ